MNSVNVHIGLVYVITSLLVVGLCLPLRANKIRPNSWYGFRFKQAFASDDNWYRINELGAGRMIAWASVLCLVGGVTLIYGVQDPDAALVCWCVPWAPLVLLIPVLQAWLLGKKLERSARAGDC